MINIHELNKERKLLKQKKQEIYKDILTKIHHKIKIVNKQKNFCYYVVPKFVIGMPLFNIHKCSDYIYKELIDSGFKVTRIHYNYFLIYWGHVTENNSSYSLSSPSQINKKNGFYQNEFINV